MTFDCTWDYSIKQETWIASIVLLVTIILIVWKLRSTIKEKSYWTAAFLGVAILFVIGIVGKSYLGTPQSVKLTDKSLVISRPIGDVEIDYTSIKVVRLVTDDDLLGQTRTFGSSGIGADAGRWKSKPLGYYEKYTTNNNNQIWLGTASGENVMFSCDTPELLVEEVRARITKID